MAATGGQHTGRQSKNKAGAAAAGADGLAANQKLLEMGDLRLRSGRNAIEIERMLVRDLVYVELREIKGRINSEPYFANIVDVLCFVLSHG